MPNMREHLHVQQGKQDHVNATRQQVGGRMGSGQCFEVRFFSLIQSCSMTAFYRKAGGELLTVYL